MAVFVGSVPYISEKPHVKKPNLPYITQIRGCGRFLGDRTEGFGCVQSRGTQAGGGTLSHDINDDRRRGRTPRLSDQAVPGTLVGEGFPLRWAYEEPHHPPGNRAEGDRTGIGQHAAEASRQAARRGDSPGDDGDVEALRRRVEELELENALMREVTDAFAASKGRYGYRGIKAALRTGVSAKMTGRIMAEDGLVAHVPGRRRYGSYEVETTPAPGNLIARDFTAERPNEKWLTDITGIKAADGKVYLSPVIECHDGKMVACADNVRFLAHFGFPGLT